MIRIIGSQFCQIASFNNGQYFLKFKYVLISCMPQLIKISALVNLLMNLSTDKKCEKICVLHIAG